MKRDILKTGRNLCEFIWVSRQYVEINRNNCVENLSAIADLS